MQTHPNLDQVVARMRPPRLAYCDYIADRIRRALTAPDPERIIGHVDRVQPDLDPIGGWLASTRKTIEVTDTRGTRYRVTVEELAP